MLPHYFSEDATYATYHYETNNATYGNTRPRRSSSFPHDDIDKDLGVVISPARDEEMVYGMADLRGKESREAMSVTRTHSVRTGVSEGTGQPYCVNATQPFDVLDQRQ